MNVYYFHIDKMFLYSSFTDNWYHKSENPYQAETG